jgi:subfamily B ATP-binding cassette protein MsbA
MLNGRGMALPTPSSPSMTAPAKELGAGAVIRRLLRDYVKGQWGLLTLAITCMLLTSATQPMIAQLVNWEIKYIFTRHIAAWLLPLALGGFGIMAFRAASMFFGRMLIDSLGEKTVAAAQADMFGHLIRRDLADLNAVHSGQFVSNFLYDATLMRDAFTQGVAAIFLELVSLAFLLAYVVVSDWQLGILSLIALPCVAYAMERLKRWMDGASSRLMAWRRTAAGGWTRNSSRVSMSF